MFIRAVEQGNTKMLENVLNKNRKTPLDLNNFVSKVEQAKLRKCIDIVDKNNKTLLYMAAEQGQLQAVQVFIDSGANLNIQTHKYGRTALFISAKNGQFDVVKALVDAGADPNIAGAAGFFSSFIDKKFPSDVAKTPKIKNYLFYQVSLAFFVENKPDVASV